MNITLTNKSNFYDCIVDQNKISKLSLDTIILPTRSTITKLKSFPKSQECKASSQSSKGIQVSEINNEILLPRRYICSDKQIINGLSFLNIKGFTKYHFQPKNNDFGLYKKNQLQKPLLNFKS